jgi:paraquat-inducible protein B
MTAGRQTAVGAFVLGGILLALGAIVFFGRFSLFNPPTRAAVVFDDSIAGLSVGSPVTFRGVRVGAVEAIEILFDPTSHTAFIPVTVTLEPSAAHVPPYHDRSSVNLSVLITRGLRAELNVQSFVTGQSAIDLDFDPNSPAVVHPDLTKLPEIPTKQSTIQRAKEQLSQLPLRELADNTNATLQSLRQLAEKLDEDLPPLVDSLKAASDRSGQTVEIATQTIKSLQGRLETTLADISQLAVSGDRQVNQRGAELHALLTASSQAVLQARDLLGELKGVASSRSGARENVESTLRDLAAAAASLRGFSSDIEHNPQLLLTGRRP